jgi:hypothetical protein
MCPPSTLVQDSRWSHLSPKVTNAKRAAAMRGNWRTKRAPPMAEVVMTDAQLTAFKTEPCPLTHESTRDHYRCSYYHGPQDRRRKHMVGETRSKRCLHGGFGAGTCPEYQENCHFSLNTVETQYHPWRYKTTMCTKMSDYFHRRHTPFCAFAHSYEELRTLPPMQALCRIATEVAMFALGEEDTSTSVRAGVRASVRTSARARARDSAREPMPAPANTCAFSTSSFDSRMDRHVRS